MLRFIRSNVVVLLVLGFYLVTVGLTMVLIDKAIYQRSKQSMIFERWGEMLSINMSQRGPLMLGLGSFLSASGDPQRAAAIEQLQRAIETEFVQTNGVWRIRVLGEGGVTVAEVTEPERIGETNTWSNALFFRNFSREIQSAQYPRGEQLLIEYSTPLNVPAIEELTTQYRWICLIVWVAISCAFFLAVRTVILPIRRVMNQVADEGTQLLRHPASALERGYNAVATQALAAQLSQRVTGLVQTPSLWTDVEFDPPLVEAVREIFDFDAVALVAVEPTTPESHVRASAAGPGLEETAEALAGLRVRHEDLAPDAEPLLLRREGETLGCLVVAAPVLETASSRVAILVADQGDWTHLPGWHREVIRAVSAEVRRGLVQMPVFRDYLFRQKSEANITLARSLGHDLTNVIATSKFDILAIQTWLRKRVAQGGEGDAPPDKREVILAESVQGLLNTTKFMQEIVNIYRAFSYMDEPRWERVDFNGLVQHLCELFRLTVSRRVEVVDALDPAVPEVMCEPRLMQLALFNLLNNANQAIKRLGEHVSGEITVATKHLGNGQVEVSVRDSGPGIRGPAGELLDGDQLYQIFFLGITTRREGEDRGEGLGLNWVWAIVRDFHGGAVEPANHPEGGAVFRLRLPVEGRPEVAEESANG